MGVYNLFGTELESVYSVGGNLLENAFDISNNQIFPDGDEPVIPDDPYIAGRTLLFEDSFNGTRLSNNWRYEIGNVRNNELQFYREQNVSVEDGKLVLTAKRESHLGKNWTSGSVTTNFDKSWTYGRFEAKIKFPSIIGAFAAFWTLGDGHRIAYTDDEGTRVPLPKPNTQGYPECGEIDITETIQGDTKTPPSNIWNCSTGSSLGSGRPSRSINTDEFHVYAMEWTSEYIAVFVDGVEHKRWTFSDFSSEAVAGYHLPQYIILNLAVGVSGGTPAETTAEMKMYVDWVRVYAPLSS